MARKFNDDDLERLKRNISIEALCRERGIDLKKHGSRDLIGKCPFHEDKNPSFVVTPDKNLFHCLGCDAGGSVIDLVMKLDKIEFKEAVQKLLPALSRVEGASTSAVRLATAAAPTCPAKLEERSGKRTAVLPEKANALLERVVAVYEKAFAEVADGKTYLEKRGITDAGLFTRHRVGYATGKLKDLLPSENVSSSPTNNVPNGTVRDDLKAIGVLLDNGHERFAGCAVFPVFDPDGRLVTLYGRFIGEGPKRHVYLPDRSTGLWNAVAVKTSPEIILVESVIDALSVMMAGHRNVIAIQGTNGLNEADVALLKTHGVQAVTLLLDGDEAGGKAAARLRPKLEAAGLTVTVKALPANEDPNSYLVGQGAEALARFLLSAAWTPSELHQTVSAETGLSAVAASAKADASMPVSPSSGPGASQREQEALPAPPDGSSLAAPGAGLPTDTAGNIACHASSVVVTYGLRKYRIMGLEKGPRKLRATIRVEHAGKLHVDTLDFYSARSRRILAMDLCRIFEETPETIDGDIEKLLRHCEQLPDKEADLSAVPRPAESLMTAAERKDAETFGKSPDLFENILADCEKRGLMGEGNNVLLLYVAMTSRKRDTPLSVLILSSSGAGKTALQDAVLAFCPPEDLVKLTALSGKALFYKERLSLKNKVLALEEGDGAEEAMYAIRNLISAGELVSESTIKDLATGRLTTMENKVEGPSSVCFTTTRPDVDPETKSRFWVTSIDESRDQTRKILSFQRQQHLSDGLITSPEIEAILRKHRNFQRLLKPVAVKNPYAAQLSYGDDRLQGRRDQPKYLNLIKAIAFLRQMTKPLKYEQRNGNAVPYIEADPDDITLANRLAHEILGHSLNELSRPGSDLLLQLEEMHNKRKAARQKESGDDLSHATPERSGVGGFSRRDIREFTGWSNTRLHVHLRELVDFEYIVIETGRNGMPFRYRLAWEGQGKDGKRFMLGLTAPDKLRDPLLGDEAK
jgi:DNA primase catalytic core